MSNTGMTIKPTPREPTREMIDVDREALIAQLHDMQAMRAFQTSVVHAEMLADLIIKHRTCAAAEERARHAKWECKTHKGNTGPNDPQECDWPRCGCDEHATRVIEALIESGNLLTPQERQKECKRAAAEARAAAFRECCSEALRRAGFGPVTSRDWKSYRDFADWCERCALSAPATEGEEVK